MAAGDELPPLSANKHAEIKTRLGNQPNIVVFEISDVVGPTRFKLADGKTLRIAFMKEPSDPSTAREAERRLRQIFIDTRGVAYATDRQYLDVSSSEIVAQVNLVLDGYILVDAPAALAHEGLVGVRPEGAVQAPISYRK